MRNIIKHSHSIVSFVIMILALYLGIQLYIGIALAFVFIGREHSQAEHRCIKDFYENKRANAPIIVGFQSRAWNKDSFLNDLLIPLGVVIIFIVVGLF